MPHATCAKDAKGNNGEKTIFPHMTMDDDTLAAIRFLLLPLRPSRSLREHASSYFQPSASTKTAMIRLLRFRITRASFAS
jgi:hypothetical protein